MRRIFVTSVAAVILAAGALYAGHDRQLFARLTAPEPAAPAPAQTARPLYTVAQRVEQFTPAVTARVKPAFDAAGLAWPPRELAYLAFKDARTLDVYGRDGGDKPWRFVKRYPVLAASGTLGPKLVEGDGQVPEGIYSAEFLNANSRFHLSIRLNYPNVFDRRMARADQRTRLGGDIMIHGNAVSAGCLAMGDEAAEDLFILSALAPEQRTQIIVSPSDFRSGRTKLIDDGQPPWIGELYDKLRAELKQYPRKA